MRCMLIGCAFPSTQTGRRQTRQNLSTATSQDRLGRFRFPSILVSACVSTPNLHSCRVPSPCKPRQTSHHRDGPVAFQILPEQFLCSRRDGGGTEIYGRRCLPKARGFLPSDKFGERCPPPSLTSQQKSQIPKSRQNLLASPSPSPSTCLLPLASCLLPLASCLLPLASCLTGPTPAKKRPAVFFSARKRGGSKQLLLGGVLSPERAGSGPVLTVPGGGAARRSLIGPWGPCLQLQQQQHVEGSWPAGLTPGLGTRAR
jgi:hypothetical protein